MTDCASLMGGIKNAKHAGSLFILNVNLPFIVNVNFMLYDIELIAK